MISLGYYCSIHHFSPRTVSTAHMWIGPRLLITRYCLLFSELFSILLYTYYSQNYAGIIYLALLSGILDVEYCLCSNHHQFFLSLIQSNVSYCLDTVEVVINASDGETSSHILVPVLNGIGISVTLESGLEEDTGFTATLFSNSQLITTTKFSRSPRQWSGVCV